MSNRCKRARSGRSVLRRTPIGGARGLMVGAATVLLVAGCGKTDAGSADGRPGAKAQLPQATTYTTVPDAPQDPDPFAKSDGTVVHPTAPQTVHARPGGPPVAVLPDKQLGSPTWVPVVETTAGWHRVLLPSRPNRATGWISADNGKLKTARSSYVVKVDTAARRLTILKSGRKVGTWTVAVGAAKTPTPVGRTFMLASLSPPKATYSPLILPVGAHSETLDSFGGGPGTVAFHGWPKKSVFGSAVTHGCVRVPADALKKLSEVPLGSPVLVTD